MCGPAVMFLQCSYVFKSYAYNYLYSYSLLCYVKFLLFGSGETTRDKQSNSRLFLCLR